MAFWSPIFLSSLYILNISPLLDLGLVKIFSQSVGCRFVLLTVSFALQKFCNFMRSLLLILDLTEQAIAVLFRNFFPCAHIFEALPHFLLYKFQCLWFYVEVFDPLRLELNLFLNKESYIGRNLYVWCKIEGIISYIGTEFMNWYRFKVIICINLCILIQNLN